MFTTCPTDIVSAGAERIWTLVTTPEEIAGWTGERLLEAPGRPLRAGDRIVFMAGPGHLLRVIFEVLEVDRPGTFALDVHLPLGIVNHEVVVLSPAGPDQCRVTLN